MDSGQLPLNERPPVLLPRYTCAQSRADIGRYVTEGNLGPPNYSMDSNPPRRRGALLSIFWIGLIAGTLDISENLIFNSFRRITPHMIFQYIASGLFGMKAFSAGMTSVILGVAVHYSIAFTWTAIYYAASRRITLLLRRPIICGLLYGGLVYVSMTFIVLPLTRVPHSTKAITLTARINAIAALLFCIGLTIALLVRRTDGSSPR
jgi:hypothetical protein